MKNAKNFIIIIVSIIAAVSIMWAVFNTGKLNQSRRLCDNIREQLITATNENRRLGETVEQCSNITAELGEITKRNISTARDCIELIEEIRVQVYNLEVCVSGFDIDEYYRTTDSLFYNEGLMK